MAELEEENSLRKIVQKALRAGKITSADIDRYEATRNQGREREEITDTAR